MQILDPVGSRSRSSRGGSDRKNVRIYTVFTCLETLESSNGFRSGERKLEGMRDSGKSRAAYTRSDAHRLTEARLGSRQGPGPARVRRLLFCPLLLTRTRANRAAC